MVRIVKWFLLTNISRAVNTGITQMTFDLGMWHFELKNMEVSIYATFINQVWLKIRLKHFKSFGLDCNMVPTDKYISYSRANIGMKQLRN